VAAKVSDCDENGSWILANVLKYNASNKSYQIQDEDDVNRIMVLPYSKVLCLSDIPNNIQRGDRVQAVFPETTSFYPATVVKTPKQTSASGSSWEIVVRFDGDEDNSGKPPPRRVPARFVVLAGDMGMQ
jgi:hypothetical protein